MVVILIKHKILPANFMKKYLSSVMGEKLMRSWSWWTHRLVLTVCAFGEVSHDIHLIFLLVGQFCSYCFLLFSILYSQRNLILWDGAAFVLETKLLWKYLAGNCRHFSRNIIVLSQVSIAVVNSDVGHEVSTACLLPARWTVWRK